MLLKSKYYVFIVSSILAFLLSCAKPINLNSIPIDNRIKCLLIPLQDLTGSYSPIKPSLEQLVQETSKNDFINYFIKGPTASYDQEVFVANYFIVHKMTEDKKFLNDFPDIPDSAWPDLNFDLIITGTVQQIRYGSPTEVSKYFIDGWLWGMWGVWAREKSEKSTRAALLEYNFKIFMAKTKQQIAAFTLQGAQKSTISDRERIVMLANKKVSEGFIYRLNNEIVKFYKISPQEYYKSGDKYYKYN